MNFQALYCVVRLQVNQSVGLDWYTISSVKGKLNFLRVLFNYFVFGTGKYRSETGPLRLPQTTSQFPLFAHCHTIPLSFM